MARSQLAIVLLRLEMDFFFGTLFQNFVFVEILELKSAFTRIYCIFMRFTRSNGVSPRVMHESYLSRFHN